MNTCILSVPSVFIVFIKQIVPIGVKIVPPVPFCWKMLLRVCILKIKRKVFNLILTVSNRIT